MLTEIGHGNIIIIKIIKHRIIIIANYNLRRAIVTTDTVTILRMRKYFSECRIIKKKKKNMNLVNLKKKLI